MIPRTEALPSNELCAQIPTYFGSINSLSVETREQGAMPATCDTVLGASDFSARVFTRGCFTAVGIAILTARAVSRVNCTVAG